jgi:hypothetical protein
MRLRGERLIQAGELELVGDLLGARDHPKFAGAFSAEALGEQGDSQAARVHEGETAEVQDERIYLIT